MIGEYIPERYKQLPPVLCGCGEVDHLRFVAWNPGVLLARCLHCERYLLYESRDDKFSYLWPESKVQDLIKASEN